jgi:hypothetical protein
MYENVKRLTEEDRQRNSKAQRQPDPPAKSLSFHEGPQVTLVILN